MKRRAKKPPKVKSPKFPRNTFARAIEAPLLSERFKRPMLEISRTFYHHKIKVPMQDGVYIAIRELFQYSAHILKREKFSVDLATWHMIVNVARSASLGPRGALRCNWRDSEFITLSHQLAHVASAQGLHALFDAAALSALENTRLFQARRKMLIEAKGGRGLSPKSDPICIRIARLRLFFHGPEHK